MPATSSRRHLWTQWVLFLSLHPVCAPYPYNVMAQSAAHDSSRAADSARLIAGAPSPTAPFSINNRGAVSMATSGSAGSLSAGYASIQIEPVPGNTTPSGVAIFGFRKGNILVSEAGVPASALISAGRIYAEVNGPVNTGLAIANPSDQSAAIRFYFTDQNGANFGSGTATIDAGGQIAAFLNQAPFNGGPSINGTFTFSSSTPVAAVALRGLENERSEFLITTLPVTPLAAATGETVYFPHFADGAGWTTQILLVNPTDDTMTGTVRFIGQGSKSAPAEPATVTIGGQSGSIFNYTVPGRSSRRFQTAGSGASAGVGSVRVIPSANGKAPSGLAIFSFRKAGVTVAEAGVSAAQPGPAFRLYAEASDVGTASIQTGVAIANGSSANARANFELTALNGGSTGLNGSVTLPGNGQVALFLNQIQGLASLTTPFQGVLRVWTDSPAGISVVGLRGRNNERGDFLITTTPAVDETRAATTGPMMFPHLADGGGYTTNFVLLSGSVNQSSLGRLQFSGQSGEKLSLALTPAPIPPPPLAIFPSPTSIAPGQTATFSALVNGTAGSAFNWSIVEGADGGSVTGTGIYTAPTRMGLYHLVATSQADPAKTATTLVTVTDTIETDRGVVIDFTQTQFSYMIFADAALSGPMVIFKATNKGANETAINLQSITCNGYDVNRPIIQNRILVARPGDTAFFKVALEYGWCKGLAPTGNFATGEYAIGSTEVQKVDFSFSFAQQPTTVTVPIRVSVSRTRWPEPSADNALPPGDTHIEVLLRDAKGQTTAGFAVLATQFGFLQERADTTGRVVFNVAKAPGYWVWGAIGNPWNSPGGQSNTLYIDGNNIQPQYGLTLTPQPRWDVSAQLLATVKGRIGFAKASTSKDGTKILMANGMENWPDPSLVNQSKLYLLDVQSGAVLWTHLLGNESWSSDLSDDGRYAIVATHSITPFLPTVTPPDVYVRLLDARNGSVIWTKQLFTSEFPAECTSQSSFGSNGVKFSHDGNFIFMGLEQCQYAYLFNRSDGSIRWRIAVERNTREVIFSSDDRFAYISPNDGWARKVSTIDGREVWRQFVGGPAFTNGLNISVDEKYLCTQTKSGDLTLLTTADGSVILQKNYGGWAGACTFSPDGRTLFGSSGGSGSDVFDVETGKELWYRSNLVGYPPPRMSSKGSWILGSLVNGFGIFDAHGNLALQFPENDRSSMPVSSVGWLSADETRYVFAGSDVNAPSGDIDVIQIYSIRVTPPRDAP